MTTDVAIRPSNSPHKALEREIKETLESFQFCVGPDINWYNACDENTEFSRRLKASKSLAAIVRRTHADITAVHRETGLCVEVDAKTVAASSENFAFEFIPFWVHWSLMSGRTGAVCIYVARHMRDGRTVGFFPTDVITTPVCIHIPPPFEAVSELIVRHGRRMFQNVTFKRGNAKGSGDPFLVLPRDPVVQNWLGWEQKILQALHPYQ